MRPGLLIVSLLAVSGPLACIARADPAFGSAADVPAPAPVLPAIAVPAPPVPPEKPPRMEIETLLGLPTAVRFDYAVVQGNGFAAMLEAVAGFEIIFPLAGVGARGRVPLWCGECNAFFLKPGIDGYCMLNPFDGRDGIFVGSVDVECVWAHRRGRCIWEVGVDVGALGPIGIPTLGGPAVGLLPMISLVAGLRF